MSRGFPFLFCSIFLVSFVFVEILLEFPIFGDFEFLFFSCLLLDELSEVHQELHLAEHRSGVTGGSSTAPQALRAFLY